MADQDGAAADPLLGTILGPCRIEAILGRGGMGAVYRAHHIPLDRPVALKVISSDWAGSPAIAAALLNEARIAARLEDPRIVQVYDAGMAGDQAYIVMQLASGETLERKVLRDGPLSQAEALRVMKEAGQALLAAHRQGVVHRDVKPGNIMLGPDGSVRLMDFGLSVAAGCAGPIQEGLSTMGSFDFMAPEQGFGAPPDARMDLYSLGATYFFVLAGRPPYAAKSPGDILLQHRDAPIPDVREPRCDATEAVFGLIRRLMAKDPAKRPQDAEEFLRELASPRLLIDLDPSGSPLKLLPPPPPPQPEGFDASEGLAPMSVPPETPAAAPPPPPPPQVPLAVKTAPPPRIPLGGRITACAVFLALSAWFWLQSCPADWAACGWAAAALAGYAMACPGLRLVVRRSAGLLACVVMLAAFYRYGLGAFALPSPMPDLLALVLGGLGAATAAAAYYLGAWEAEPTDRSLSLGLAASSAILLFLAAVILRLPPQSLGIGAVADAVLADGRTFLDSAGPWRWGGALGLATATLIWVHKSVPAAFNRRTDKANKANVANWNR